MTELLHQIGANSPWAAMAGFLLHQVIKAWNADRAVLTQLLGEFKDAINELRSAVNGLSDRIERVEGQH
ncbi:MAG: hypothetical protein JSS66_00215 [Armatimonadetes bacterium]|nr:hypothetical protein [Armatimonadota bacterium]